MSKTNKARLSWRLVDDIDSQKVKPEENAKTDWFRLVQLIIQLATFLLALIVYIFTIVPIVRYQDLQEKHSSLLLANRNLEESYLDVKSRIYPVEQELKNVDRKLSEATSELRIIETQKRNEKMLIDAKTMESRFETFLEFSWAPDDVSNKGMHALIREVDPIVFDPDAILRSLISSGGEFSKLVQTDIGEKRIGAETCHPISHKVLIEIADDTVVNLKETAASLAQTHYLATNKSNPIQKGLGKRTTKIIDDTRKSKSESKAYFDVITNYELPLSAVSKYSSRCISEAYNVYSFHRDRVLKKTGIAHELVNINISDPSWIMFRRINGVQGEELSNSYQY